VNLYPRSEGGKVSLTVDQLAAAVGIQARMVRRYIAKEGIEPDGVSGRRNLYPAGAVQTIKAAILVGRAYRRGRIKEALRSKAPNARCYPMRKSGSRPPKGVRDEPGRTLDVGMRPGFGGQRWVAPWVHRRDKVKGKG
jgi:hypothetical protein